MSNEINQNIQFPQVLPNTENNKSSQTKTGENWFETMADAWGKALDVQANRIIEQSQKVTTDSSSPADVTKLTAESLRMSFIANSSHTSLTSVGTALDTLARKQ